MLKAPRTFSELCYGSAAFSFSSGGGYSFNFKSFHTSSKTILLFFIAQRRNKNEFNITFGRDIEVISAHPYMEENDVFQFDSPYCTSNVPVLDGEGNKIAGGSPSFDNYRLIYEERKATVLPTNLSNITVSNVDSKTVKMSYLPVILCLIILFVAYLIAFVYVKFIKEDEKSIPMAVPTFAAAFLIFL